VDREKVLNRCEWQERESETQEEVVPPVGALH
jgi:hypothetical protein